MLIGLSLFAVEMCCHFVHLLFLIFYLLFQVFYFGFLLGEEAILNFD